MGEEETIVDDVPTERIVVFWDAYRWVIGLSEIAHDSINRQECT